MPVVEWQGTCLAFEIDGDFPVRLLHVGYDLKEVRTIPERHLWAYRLVELRVAGEDHDYIGAGRLAGGGISGRLRYVSHQEETVGDQRVLRIVQLDAITGLEVTSELQLQDGVIVSRTHLHNAGSAMIVLLDVSAFFLVGLAPGSAPRGDRAAIHIPRSGWYAEFQWTRHLASELGLNNRFAFGSRHETVRSVGSWCSSNYLPMGYVENVATGGGLLFEILHGGSWSWQVGETADELYLHVAGPGEAEGWWHTLAPGKSFHSAAVALAPAASIDESIAAMTRHRRRSRLVCADGAPVVFNDYMNCLMGDPTEAKILPLVEQAAALGAEVYCIDAGWYARPGVRWSQTLGDWSVNPDRFPNGLEPIIERIRALGMVAGLWFEIEGMTENCPGFHDLPDDWFFMRHERRVVSHRRYQLDFRNANVRAFADAAIHKAVGELGIGFLKLDYNFDSGVGSDTGAESPGRALVEYEAAFLGWLDGLRARYPALMIEHCASGGQRLARPYLDRTHNASNSDEGDPVQIARIAAAGPSMILPEQNGTWALPQQGDDDAMTAFAMCCAIPFRMLLAGGSAFLSGPQRDLVVEGIAVHKRFRHLLSEAVPGWPLGLPAYDESWICVSLNTLGTKLLAVWRRDGGADHVSIPVGPAVEGELVYPRSLPTPWQLSEGRLHLSLPERNARIFLLRAS